MPASRTCATAARHGCADLAALADLLRKSVDNALIYEIVEAMTTNETLFFRDDKPFKYFRSALLPLLMKNRGHKKSLRIWSAACSTGQEPYSIAITMSDLLQEHPGWTVDILGTDISGSVIERARQMPGREKEVWDYYRNNPNALAQLRAPIYEDKVVDFILELANVTEKKVSREELFKDEDEKAAA